MTCGLREPLATEDTRRAGSSREGAYVTPPVNGLMRNRGGLKTPDGP